MIRIRQALRLHRILYILARNGLDRVLISMGLFPSIRFFIYLNPWNWRRKQESPAVALRKSLEELGPIFIKFGQALSTRPDILPIEVAEELAKLQDKVPPFSSSLAERIIEQALGKPINVLFLDFEPQVLASASIAQVHAATLLTGQTVVIKVLRPGIRKVIDEDLSLLLAFAEIMDKYWPLAKRFKPIEIVNEFAHHLLDEIDLRREAANASQLRRNFDKSPLLYVPEIHWDYLRENVLVMERINGIPVSDIATLNEYKIDLKKLAERGVEIFFTQVFRDCFFHADMHPGNIFVSPLHPDSPQYISVDFGIVGTLNDNDKRYLAENLLAFFNRDYKRVAELHVESGWVARNTRVDAFESAIRTVCEPVINKPLKDISFAELALRLFQVAQRFEMEVQPQLILLQKTLFAVEGLGRQLYPSLNLWETAKPFLENWVKSQVGPKVFLRKFRDTIPFLTEKLPVLPQLVHDVLVAIKNEKRFKERELTQQKEPPNPFIWYSFGSGLFLMLTAMGTLSYFDFMDKTLSIATVLIGIVGSLGLLIFKRS